MAYRNPILNYLDERPVVGFFMIPVIMHFGGVVVGGMVRKARFNSYFAGSSIFNTEDPTNPLAGLGNPTRTEGGSADDLMFRATISDRPTGPGQREQEEIQRRPEGAPVRYDVGYHDSIFFPKLDYKDNKQVMTQSLPSRATESYVFAGISGLNKINMR
jgi:hypothetical protein